MLRWTNAIVIVLMISCIVISTFMGTYVSDWLELVPILLQGLVLIFSLRRIQKEIKLLGFDEYYASNYIIFIHLGLLLAVIISLSSFMIFEIIYVVNNLHEEDNQVMPGVRFGI